VGKPWPESWLSIGNGFGKSCPGGEREKEGLIVSSRETETVKEREHFKRQFTKSREMGNGKPLQTHCLLHRKVRLGQVDLSVGRSIGRC